MSLNTVYAADSCRSLIVNNSSFKIPTQVQQRFPKLAKSQPSLVLISKKQDPLLVHNSTIANLLKQAKDKPNKNILTQIITLLNENHTFHFPITEEGFLPAANNGDHHGGYGAFVWLRDLARASSGVSALPELLNRASLPNASEKRQAQGLTSAMLRLFSEKDQVLRTLQNIIQPDRYHDPANGFRNVIFVRLGLEGRKNGKTPNKDQIEEESRWGHKQNDALALYGHAILDRISSGEIQLNQLSTDVQAEFLYLVSYFERIQYFKIEDVGAWEERMGVRTSSIGLVTSFLERFHAGWNQNQKISKQEKEFFKILRDSWTRGEIKTHLIQFMNQNPNDFSVERSQAWDQLNQSLQKLPHTISESYSLLFPRLGIRINDNGSRSYHDLKEVDGPHETRGEDAALLHLLLYPPQRLTVSDRIHVVNQLKTKLMRASGFVRYNQDWFLNGGPTAVEFASQLPFDPDMIAVKDQNGFRPSNRSDRDLIYSEYYKQKFDKNMSSITSLVGSDLDAQWSFQDSMLTQIYTQLFHDTKNKEFIENAWFHLARALSAITGMEQINVEGHRVQAFKAPEAWIPVQLIDQNQNFTVYFTSPNSPLNWTTAELVTALNQFIKAHKNENDRN